MPDNNQNVIKTIKNHVSHLQKALKTHDLKYIKNVISKEVPKIGEDLLCSINGSVSLDSPKNVYPVYDANHSNVYPIIGLDHRVKSMDEKIDITVHEDYLDSISYSSSHINKIGISNTAKFIIYTALCACLDFEHKTKHHIYLNTGIVDSKDKFDRTINALGFYKILNARTFSKHPIPVSKHSNNFNLVVLHNQDYSFTAKGDFCIVTYIPEKALSSAFIKLLNEVDKINSFKIVKMPKAVTINDKNQFSVKSKVIKSIPKSCRKIYNMGTFFSLLTFYLSAKIYRIKKVQEIVNKSHKRTDIKEMQDIASHLISHYKKRIQAISTFAGYPYCHYTSTQQAVCLIAAATLKQDNDNSKSIYSCDTTALKILKEGYQNIRFDYISSAKSDSELKSRMKFLHSLDDAQKHNKL